MIEEAYEAVDAINSGNKDKLIEELGDVLLQVIFHSIIAEENSNLNLRMLPTNVQENDIQAYTCIWRCGCQ